MQVGDADANRPEAELQSENQVLREELARSSSGHAVLEDEVRGLREELMRKSASLDYPVGQIRRPMAAIAGGGFRGPTHQVTVQRPCMCDSLRAKLAKVRAELKEAREVDPRTPAESEEVFPPPPPCLDAESQTLSSDTIEASAQYDPAMPLDFGTLDFGTQVSAPTSPMAPVVPTLADAMTQAEAQTMDMEVQANGGSSGSDAVVQTIAQESRCADIQVGCPFALMVGAASQTQATQLVDASVQAQGESSQQKPSRDVSIQAGGSSSSTAAPSKATTSAASMQTELPQQNAVGIQVVPCRLDQGVQVQDDGARAQDAAMRKRLADLEVELVRRSKLEYELEGQLRELTELSDVWRNAAQTKALGQMNVTILCPRAECTVNGEFVQMDSWDPKKLKADFEREVLPRFARVFVNEEGNGAAAAFPPARGTRASTSIPGKRRPEAVEQAMQEFASVFRERLSSMLSAPNASAAVQSAGNPATGRRSTAA